MLHFCLAQHSSHSVRYLVDTELTRLPCIKLCEPWLCRVTILFVRPIWSWNVNERQMRRAAEKSEWKANGNSSRIHANDECHSISPLFCISIIFLATFSHIDVLVCVCERPNTMLRRALRFYRHQVDTSKSSQKFRNGRGFGWPWTSRSPLQFQSFQTHLHLRRRFFVLSPRFLCFGLFSVTFRRPFISIRSTISPLQCLLWICSLLLFSAISCTVFFGLMGHFRLWLCVIVMCVGVRSNEICKSVSLEFIVQFLVTFNKIESRKLSKVLPALHTQHSSNRKNEHSKVILDLEYGIYGVTSMRCSLLSLSRSLSYTRL